MRAETTGRWTRSDRNARRTAATPHDATASSVPRAQTDGRAIALTAPQRGGGRRRAVKRGGRAGPPTATPANAVRDPRACGRRQGGTAADAEAAMRAELRGPTAHAPANRAGSASGRPKRTRARGARPRRRRRPERAGARFRDPNSDYELFKRNNFNIRYRSWNYRGCWHQTCPPVDPR